MYLKVFLLLECHGSSFHMFSEGSGLRQLQEVSYHAGTLYKPNKPRIQLPLVLIYEPYIPTLNPKPQTPYKPVVLVPAVLETPLL